MGTDIHYSCYIEKLHDIHGEFIFCFGFDS